MAERVPHMPDEVLEMALGVERALGQRRLSLGGLAAGAWLAGYKQGLNEARADRAFAPALAAHNRTAGDSMQQRREAQA